ncbi:MAG: hypothetical protein GF383_01840, partial [Candidatus Lokiarchaeota archaeon]|nr:hypothetical protein [Candidatus Lokiarchaeota archaeon]MBD3338086.1 hypothetical protein [Candidatus Lokiarchaeota archaeon]
MSEENSYLRPLIVDFGTITFRLGWAGADNPEIIGPSVYVDTSDFIFTSEVIRGISEILINENESLPKYFFGEEALYYQNILKIHELMEEQNFGLIEKYFYNYYQKLNIPQEFQFKQPVIVITPFYLTDLEKKKIQHMFFQTFDFPSLLFLSESQAILASLQKSSGVVINMGESHTYISTILHGFTNIMARDIFPIAGKELTNAFLNMVLKEKGAGRNLYLTKTLAKEIKEKTCLCVNRPKILTKQITEGLKDYNQTISFPDGSSLVINVERFMLTEPLFDPKLIHIDYIKLDQALANIIKT